MFLGCDGLLCSAGTPNHGCLGCSRSSEWVRKSPAPGRGLVFLLSDFSRMSPFYALTLGVHRLSPYGVDDASTSFLPRISPASLPVEWRTRFFLDFFRWSSCPLSPEIFCFWPQAFMRIRIFLIAAASRIEPSVLFLRTLFVFCSRTPWLRAFPFERLDFPSPFCCKLRLLPFSLLCSVLIFTVAPIPLLPIHSLFSPLVLSRQLPPPSISRTFQRARKPETFYTFSTIWLPLMRLFVSHLLLTALATGSPPVPKQISRERPFARWRFLSYSLFKPFFFEIRQVLFFPADPSLDSAFLGACSS